MKEVAKHTITIEPKDERYNYSRNTTLTLSEEFFTLKEIAKISSIAFTAALRSGASITSSITPVEIPVDEEEGWKVRAEKSEKAKEEQFTELQKTKREKTAFEIRLKALDEHDPVTDNPTLVTIIERLLIDDITASRERDNVHDITASRERDNVRKILIEQGVLS